MNKIREKSGKSYEGYNCCMNEICKEKQNIEKHLSPSSFAQFCLINYDVINA